ncbi:MAG: hypothetical protein DMG05_05190, partial [Acidobacteria bacterium]
MLDLRYTTKLFGVLFFVSGFCGLLYQIVWIRLAFASFGIITPVLSVVISVFMLGLSLGSWAGGKWIESLTQKTGISAMFFYGLAEVLIGVGAFVVPRFFSIGETSLLSLGEMSSAGYLLLSASIITFSILPWCFLMGATFPVMMSFVGRMDDASNTSFSFLYLANVLGAMAGAALTAGALVEMLGFNDTLWVAASSNFAIAFISLMIGLSHPRMAAPQTSASAPLVLSRKSVLSARKPGLVFSLLFTTGFISMAMEVVWTRAFTPVLKTTIYSFALLLTTYLLATWFGSYFYRKHIARKKVLSTAQLIAGLSIFGFLPLLFGDPRAHLKELGVLLSVFPFCSSLGYLTPKLVDQYSSGYPERAGRAFAVNILGSILGPISAGYVLLPQLGVKISMVLLGVPFLFYFLTYCQSGTLKPAWRAAFGSSALVLLMISLLFITTYEQGESDGIRVVRRDYAATVISTGTGMDKQLLVNGIGITELTPATKVMAHLPLAFLDHPAQSALVICFGMGTTFRSLMSWGIKVTAVELVPSVKEAFGYYFSDAESLSKDPNGQIVIDDGRRFLKRTTETFDLITLDPPPPPEAAGSSLLYSEEFYSLVKRRLRKEGLLQQWFPSGETKILQAVARSLERSFPHVKAFRSIGDKGTHFLASPSPLQAPTVEEMISRLPLRAKRDLVEWEPSRPVHMLVTELLEREIPLDTL